MRSFNGHPPLGVNATLAEAFYRRAGLEKFQWAPTLGGECYVVKVITGFTRRGMCFNGHPPLGVNATTFINISIARRSRYSFNGHPPLGVNATGRHRIGLYDTGDGFNGHPPLGVNATLSQAQSSEDFERCFNGHPPLGVNATDPALVRQLRQIFARFNGHPPLGVNATSRTVSPAPSDGAFQWAPTLGGECYYGRWMMEHISVLSFNGHPPLGVNATGAHPKNCSAARWGFNGHPPLGVNATKRLEQPARAYPNSFNGHPPLGVNATARKKRRYARKLPRFQWAPTLGGECYSSFLLIS